MTKTIFPDLGTAGAQEIRDATGVCLNPPDVENAYCPAAQFVITPCNPTGLPSTCDARIEPRQINAIVSELLSFAECLDPSGPWNCNSLQNLCAAFTAWAAINVSGIYIGDTPNVGPKVGQLWWESDTGYLFIWYDDGSTQQWVQVAGPPVLPKTDTVSIVGTGSTVNPLAVALVDCGVY
jgi:hypothetical protein